jgi:hypothetical protein
MSAWATALRAEYGFQAPDAIHFGDRNRGARSITLAVISTKTSRDAAKTVS